MEGVAGAIWLLHVQRERWLPVRRRRHHDMVSRRFGWAMRLDEVANGFRPFVPADVRRHLPDSVLRKQLDDALDVVVLEGGDVVGKQSLGMLVVERLIGILQ